MTAAEAEMADLVNELRASLGLNPLVYDPGLVATARRWSQIMGAERNFEHNPYAGYYYPPGYRFQGENIAGGRLTTTLSEAVQRSFSDLVNSPLHYTNMTRTVTTHFGVGVVVKAGRYWITQHFAS